MLDAKFHASKSQLIVDEFAIILATNAVVVGHEPSSVLCFESSLNERPPPLVLSTVSVEKWNFNYLVFAP